MLKYAGQSIYTMKRIVTKALAVMAIMAAPMLLKAQNASEGTVKFNKTECSAVIAEFDYPADLVKAALAAKLNQAGFGKQRTQRGFMAYKGVNWNEVSSEKLDVYARVDGKKKRATVSLLAAKGYDNFVSNSSDPAAVDRMKQFLNGFAADIVAYQQQLDIRQKEADLQKAQKAYNEHTRKQKKLDEDRAKLAEELDKLKKTN